jgi:hypothetical protein
MIRTHRPRLGQARMQRSAAEFRRSLAPTTSGIPTGDAAESLR